MIKKEIENIIFDLGGVIVDLDRHRCVKAFGELGVSNVEELTGNFNQSGFFMQFELGEIDAKKFRDEVRKNSTLELTDTQIDNAWNSFLVSTPRYKFDALAELSERYSLYLLSNTNELHWQWYTDYAMAEAGFDFSVSFQQVFLSYKLHKAKPSPAIFQDVLNATGILPRETLFIDDSAANCETAELLGITVYRAEPGEDWRHLFNS